MTHGKRSVALVVDDNLINRTLLATNLEEQDYQVEQAVNGLHALEVLASHPVDVILLDLLMPEMDGYQLLERLKNDEDLRHIPVIVISALDEMDSVVRCIEMGATDYLTKPFDPVLLRARMKASLAEKRLRDAEQAYLQEITAERDRADKLLLNILPAPVADQLKQGNEKIVESFADVTVLFADVKDFTPWSATRKPSEILEVLSSIFNLFDNLVDKYGVEKIKTIGDAYMAASGLPIPRSDHAAAVANLALDMMTEFANLDVVQREAFKLRVGINSGPVVAGVIGTKKFIYDMWGDTVNTASRMQTHCPIGAIQVSSGAYERLKNQFLFLEQGVVQIRSKGEMNTYLLIGRKN